MEASRSLGPDYHCSLCVRPQKKIAPYCKGCSLGDLNIETDREAEAELLRWSGRFPRGFDFKGLIDLYYGTNAMLGRNRNQTNRKWPVRSIRLAEIILSERSQFRYASSWDDLQRLKASNRNG